MSLDDPISVLPRTATQTKKKLSSINIRTIWDLLNCFPARFQQYPKPRNIAEIYSIKMPEINSQEFFFDSDALPVEMVTVCGSVVTAKNVYTRRGMVIQKCLLKDESGQIELVWFNQRYLLNMVKPGTRLQASGKLNHTATTSSIQVVDYDVITDTNHEVLHTRELVPIYPEKNGVSTRLVREKIHIALSQCMSKIPETLPKDIIAKNQLMDEQSAYQQIHRPDSLFTIADAKRRLAFDELFIAQYAALSIKKSWEKEVISKPFVLLEKIKQELGKFIQRLPFVLTSDQKQSIKEIIADMTGKIPMNRLLLGEVGSGKTVVATLAAYFCYLNGYKSLFMAPTEILAQQHYDTLEKLLGKNLKINLITSSQKKKETDGDILVGTHSLLFTVADFSQIGFVAVDEQHKFGVTQRATLRKKALIPHLLTMTATPIPRTVLLTLYGYLKTSNINTLPVARKPIKTYVVTPEKRTAAYQWISKEILESKSQAFIVCPLIEESDHESLKDIKSAKLEFERIQNDIFPDFRVALLHGKLKSKEKQAVMEAYGRREIDILVATPVVEVGIDFPNATIIIIEAAERFGLAQLHQLRGRVGRGEKQSHCLVFTEKNSDLVKKRLHYFATHSRGAELAEYDLKMRGAGEMFGTRQHGLTEFRFADISDFDFVAKAQAAAVQLQNQDLPLHPILALRVSELTKNLIAPD